MNQKLKRRYLYLTYLLFKEKSLLLAGFWELGKRETLNIDITCQILFGLFIYNSN